jgi:hypothetical protein
MGNRLPGGRSRRKPGSSSATAARGASPAAPLDRAPSAAGAGHGSKARSAGVRLRNAVNNRLSGRSSRSHLVSCPDLGAADAVADGNGVRSTETIPYGGGGGSKGATASGAALPPAVSSPAVDAAPTIGDDSSSPQAPVGVTVYRSYSSTAADGGGPSASMVSVAADYGEDDGVFTSGAGSRFDVVGATTVTNTAAAAAADSVPDIKIYRRSAVLYDDDEDDDELFDGDRLNMHR